MASTSRSFGGADVTSSFIRRIEISATASTARSNASALIRDGFVDPLIFRTYCSAALCTSSRVAGGSKLYSGRMLRHMPKSYGPELSEGRLATVHSMGDIVDDKKHIRGTLDLSNAVWQRAAGSEELEGPHLEIAFVQDGYVAMRSSEHPVDDQTLLFTPSEWEAFVLGAKDGEFDVI